MLECLSLLKAQKKNRPILGNIDFDNEVIDLALVADKKDQKIELPQPSQKIEIEPEKNEITLALTNNIEAEADQVQEQVVEEISDFKLGADSEPEAVPELKNELAAEVIGEVESDSFILEQNSSESMAELQAEAPEQAEVNNDNLESLMNNLFAESNENEDKKEEI